jgi:hypothetical protein
MTAPRPVPVLLAGPPRLAQLDLPGDDTRLVRRHLALVAALAEGRLTPGEFRRQAAKLPALSGGLRLVDDPVTALALVEQARAADIDLTFADPGEDT